MSEEEKEKTTTKKEVEELRKEVEQKGREIQELKEKVEELRAQVSKGETRESLEVDRVLREVSEILDMGFNIFGVSSSKQNKKAGNQGLIGLIGDLAKLAEESTFYRKEIDFGGKRGVIDFHVRTGPLNGSSRSSRKPRRGILRRRPSVQPRDELIETTEPLVDIFDEEDKIRVMAEIPGVEKDEVKLEVTEDILTIKVDTSARKYYKDVKLPTAVEKEIVESTYRNGILEVKLKKRE